MKKSELCNQVSIVDIYNDFSGFTCANPKDLVPCPFHNDGTPSMRLYTKNNRWICFGCGEQGSPIDFVMKIKNVGFVEAIHIISDHYGCDNSAPTIRDPKAYEKTKQFHELMGRIAQRFADNETNYWELRGIPEGVQRDYHLGKAPDTLRFDTGKDLSFYQTIGLCNHRGDSMYSGRLIIPIMDKYGFICGFAGRSDRATEPKYINSPDCEYFHKGQLLYNYHQAKTASTIYVVEGYMDVLSAVTAGKTNVVATMGTALTAEQIELLQGKEVILGFDTDPAGIMATYNAIVKYPNIKFKVLTPLKGGKDLNDILMHKGADAVVNALSNVQDGIMWLIDRLVATYDVEKPEDADATWEILSGVIGALEIPYQKDRPMNTIYTPVALRRYWRYYYNKLNIKEE